MEFNTKLSNISACIFANISATKEGLWRISIFMDAWGNIMKKYKEKSEVITAFFASDFISKTNTQALSWKTDDAP